VAEAIKVLKWAGILTWQHRIARVRERCRDPWGRHGWRWRVVRSSNAYVFRDPGKVDTHPAENRRFPSTSENPPGTPNQLPKPTSLAPDSPLERTLASLGALIAAKDAYEGRCCTAEAKRSDAGTYARPPVVFIWVGVIPHTSTFEQSTFAAGALMWAIRWLGEITWPSTVAVRLPPVSFPVSEKVFLAR
jgi:hypothetical protein